MNTLTISPTVNNLLASLSFREKVGQLNQKLLGWQALEVKNGRIIATDLLKQEIEHWGGLGTLYGVFRADPWSGRHWGNGILPQMRGEAISVLQETVVKYGEHGIQTLVSEEAPHGHQALGGTVLPPNLGMGASFDPETVRQAQAAVARELALSGVHLALVSGLDIARDPRWGRTEECFGEDPFMAASFVEETVLGMQGENRCKVKDGQGVAVVLKHLAAQGEAVGGRNGQSAVIGMNDLRDIHLAPVAAGARAGALGFMAAYNDIDSLPCCANPWLLKTYLRDELGFDGIVMADGVAVDRLQEMVGSIPQAGRTALLSGIDISLWDEGFTHLDEFEDDPEVVHAVNEACARVLALKECFHLLPTLTASNTEMEGSTENNGDTNSKQSPSSTATVHLSSSFDDHKLKEAFQQTQRLSYELAREALVSLKDDTNIPVLSKLSTSDKHPLVITGPFANDTWCYLGDYTAPQQGEESGEGSFVIELQKQFPQLAAVIQSDPRKISSDNLKNAAGIIFLAGGTSQRSYTSSFDTNGAAKDVDEFGATGGEGVDSADLSLPWHQDEQLNYIAAQSMAPVTTIVISGRAHVLTTVMRASHRVIWAGYPGPFAARALVEALNGEFSLTGRMPVTLPANSGVVPLRYNDRQSADGVYRDCKQPTLAWFGSSQNALDGITISPLDVLEGDTSDVVSVTIRAAEKRKTEYISESLLLMRHEVGGMRIPRMRELVASDMLHLKPGEQKTLTWTIPHDRGIKTTYSVC